jgi:rubrerythrin
LPENEIDEYLENWKWLEIIRRPPKEKEETPTEKIRRELEEIEALKRKAMKATEVDKLVPKIKLMIADEQKGIKEYEQLYELLKDISFATGMLEPETRVLKGIIEDEKNHKKELERILKELTR